MLPFGIRGTQHQIHLPMKDGHTTLRLAATSDGERDQWADVLKEAVFRLEEVAGGGGGGLSPAAAESMESKGTTAGEAREAGGPAATESKQPGGNGGGRGDGGDVGDGGNDGLVWVRGRCAEHPWHLGDTQGNPLPTIYDMPGAECTTEGTPVTDNERDLITEMRSVRVPCGPCGRVALSTHASHFVMVPQPPPKVVEASGRAGGCFSCLALPSPTPPPTPPTHPLTHSPTHPLTHSPIHPCPPSPSTATYALLPHAPKMVAAVDAPEIEKDDMTLIRFLRARDLKLDKSTAMWKDYIAWRKTYVEEFTIIFSVAKYLH